MRPGLNRGSLTLNLAAACFAAFIAILAAEAVARVVWVDPIETYRRHVPPQWRDLPELISMVDLAAPNQRGLASKVLFATNSQGIRGPERSPEKAENVFRIVVLGDSFAMGWGVLYEDMWSTRLENHLNKLAEARPVEVVNVALAGLNTDALVSRYAGLGLKFQPDLAIYGFNANDIEGDLYRRSADQRFNPYRYTDSPSFLVRTLGPQLLAMREKWLPPPGSYVFELDDNYFDNAAAWNALLAGMDRLRAINDRRGICTVMLIQPNLAYLDRHHPFRRHYDAAAKAARERSFFVINALNRHLGHNARDLHVGVIDAHPNAKGHAILFEALLEGLGELTESCWGRGGNPLR